MSKPPFTKDDGAKSAEVTSKSNGKPFAPPRFAAVEPKKPAGATPAYVVEAKVDIAYVQLPEPIWN